MVTTQTVILIPLIGNLMLVSIITNQDGTVDCRVIFMVLISTTVLGIPLMVKRMTAVLLHSPQIGSTIRGITIIIADGIIKFQVIIEGIIFIMAVGERLMEILTTDILIHPVGNGTKENIIIIHLGIVGYQVIFGGHIFIMVHGILLTVVQIITTMVVFHQDGKIAKIEINTTTVRAGTVDSLLILEAPIFITGVGTLVMEILMQIKTIIHEIGDKIKENITTVYSGIVGYQVILRAGIFTMVHGILPTVAPIMTTIVVFHQDGKRAKIETNIIITRAGIVGCQVILQAVISIMVNGLTKIIPVREDKDLILEKQPKIEIL